MNRQQRKKAFLLVSNGGFLDSIEKGWDKVKSEFGDLSMKKTVDEIFGDSKEDSLEQTLNENPKLKKELQETVSPSAAESKSSPQSEEEAPKREKSLREIVTNLVQEMKDVMSIKDKEQSIAAPEQNPSTKYMLEGYRRPSGYLPSDAHDKAEKLLDLPLGSAKSVKLNDGKWYVAVVEEHFDNHPRGYGEPYTHKGVSLFEPVTGDGEDRGENIV